MTVALLQEPGWAEPLTQHNSNARHLPLVYGRKTIFCMGGLQFIVVESSKRPKGDGSETGATGGGGGGGCREQENTFSKYSRVVLPPPYVHTPSCESFSLHPGTITVWSPNTCRWSQETPILRQDCMKPIISAKDLFDIPKKKNCFVPFRNYMTESIIMGMLLQKTWWIKTGHGMLSLLDRASPW